MLGWLHSIMGKEYGIKSASVIDLAFTKIGKIHSRKCVLHRTTEKKYVSLSFVASYVFQNICEKLLCNQFILLVLCDMANFVNCSGGSRNFETRFQFDRNFSPA